MMSVNPVRASVGFLLVIALAAACGNESGGVSTTESSATPTTTPTTIATTTTEPEQTTTTVATETTLQARSPDATLAFAFDDCNQVAFVMPLDLEAARALVPSDYAIYPEGGLRATMWLWAKDCGDITVEGTSVGAGQFDALMIQVDGPFEVRQSKERPDLPTNVIDYQHPILWITDNAEFQAATAAFGTPMVLADEMTFNVEPGTIHTGSAVAATNDPPIEYRWASTTELGWEPGADEFVAHTVVNQDDAAVYRYHVEAILNRAWSGRAVEFDPGETSLAAAIGSPITGTGYGMTIAADLEAERMQSMP